MPLAEIDHSTTPPRISVETQWNDKELIKEVPSSRWDAELRRWVVPLSWAACLQLRGLFGDRLQVGPALAVWSQQEMTDRIGPARDLRGRITRTSGYWEKLYDFQTSGAEFLVIASAPTRVGNEVVHSGGALLGDDLGLGKTAQILAALEGLLTKLSPEDALPAIVFCPNSVKSGWARQAKMWGSRATVYVVEGSATKRRKTLDEARNDPTALVIMNTEAVRLFSRLAPYGSVALARCRECSKHGEEKLTAARCEVHPKPLNNFGFKTVIMDEAHGLKDPKSKQTRAVWAVGHGPTVRRRWALTGTPVSNHVGDLWGIMHFLVPHEYPVKSKYVDRYALMSWNAHGGLDIVGINPQVRDEFYAILDPRFRRTQQALVLDQLPQVIRPTRWVDMSVKQQRAYNEIESQYITRLDDGQILITPSNLMKAQRLLQFASSYAEVELVVQRARPDDECVSNQYSPCVVPDHDESCPLRLKSVVYLREPSRKLDAVMEDIFALGGSQAVVAAQSRQLINLLAKRLDKAKTPYSLLTGAVPDYEREVNKRHFITGNVQLILMTIDAGGTGVDGLQVANTMLVLQRSWKMLANIQLDGRVHRIGSEQHDVVKIVDYVTEGTIEETTLYPRLQEKWERLEEINRDRVRLTAAGITPEQRFELDKRESMIQSAWLGAP